MDPEFTFDRFKGIFREGETYPFVGLIVEQSGVWLEILEGCDLSPDPDNQAARQSRLQRVGDVKRLLAAEEWDTVAAHPRGDEAEPLLRFRCSRAELTGFLRWAIGEGAYDPGPAPKKEIRELIGRRSVTEICGEGRAAGLNDKAIAAEVDTEWGRKDNGGFAIGHKVLGLALAASEGTEIKDPVSRARRARGLKKD